MTVFPSETDDENSDEDQRLEDQSRAKRIPMDTAGD